MKKDLEKILFNPVRLKVISFLITVDRASFKKLIEISGATKGNTSIQITFFIICKPNQFG